MLPSGPAVSTIVSGGAGRTNLYAAQIARALRRTIGPSVTARSRQETKESRDGSRSGPKRRGGRAGAGFSLIAGRSLRLHSSGLDDAAPALVILFQELAELGGRIADRGGAEGFQA